MSPDPDTEETTTVGLLLSGGLDSGILLGHLLRQGFQVQPFYVRSELAWEEVELQSLRRFLKAVRGYPETGTGTLHLAQTSEPTHNIREPVPVSGQPVSPAPHQLRELVVLDLPLADVYGSHWSMTGREIPDAESPDEAVYLPGRNLLLLVKVAVWCQMHGIGRLALGVLGSNPFHDATPGFFELYQAALSCGLGTRFEILRPFAGLSKREVMELGRGLPLEWTFSCIAPVEGLHCGRCNKCAERQAAFRLVGAGDPTRYASSLSARY